MDITLYVLLTLGLAILLLAMWACAANGVNRWGPDLTAELPPYLLQEVFKQHETQKKCQKAEVLCPSAPSEFCGDPLLTNAHPIGKSEPPLRTPARRAPPPPPPPVYSQPVKVLPREFVPKPPRRPNARGDPV